MDGLLSIVSIETGQQCPCQKKAEEYTMKWRQHRPLSTHLVSGPQEASGVFPGIRQSTDLIPV